MACDKRFSLSLLMLSLTLALPLQASQAAPSSADAQRILSDRAAQGDITRQGGARRLLGDQTEALRASLSNRPAKNVILLIGDGMGDAEITAARNYAAGAGGMLPGIDALPLTGQYTHYALDRKTHKPNYVTDSAASATAWSSGVKTYNGALGIDVTGKAYPTLLEMARAAGKATGNVSTAELQDATPAAMFAHVSGRKCYGPQETREKCPENALENGGAGSITEQMLQTRADVTLGGGAKSFAQTVGAGEFKGKTLLQQAQAQGYHIVNDLAGMDAVTTADQQRPLLGLFAAGNMPVRWLGPKATRHGNQQAPVTCQPNPQRNADQPTLAQMTNKAISLLSKNPNGFFLQVEGASIDKQDHAANPCGQFGETVDLDEAVQAALDFARREGNTLVVVTADHAHTSQIIPNDAKAPGLTQTLLTRDGAPMTISYGTSEEDDSQEHTGAQLRIAAYGPHAGNVVGLTDQTDLFFTLRDALGLPAQNNQ
ncbi:MULTISPECIES: alkaline phosphatase [Edwardsiella]|uniref:alkaline phosphatase n=1 Tax=Edwardsiella TaxID=635 RepID=UPI0002D2B801|nr:alkaline phosphatase [Edwardsiella tarda]ATI64729.1 alkaline phosphatase [Edwardsiella tarda]UAL56184.1 alkaline phosphatase [Edwardsiella tarda]UCQ28261.1 alkaline phosphatase [Edwardsiella tarda]STD28372.1 Alkaline phosphatase precursor [Edwardsiella tarda]BEH71398.1 alkaline phosphatase [Edwardsiella tarda]